MENSEGGKGSPPQLLLDRMSYVPFYQQIVEQLSGLIRSKQFPPGQVFWSEGEIAISLGISKMTVRQAFQELRREGLLEVEKGRRPTIGSGRVSKDFQELRGFTEEMSRRGMKASSKVLGIFVVDPDSAAAGALRLAPGERVYRLRRLRYANKKIIGLETSHLPC